MNMSELKYKVGDKVRIKSLDWYNKNKDKNGNIRYKHGNVYPIFFTKYMSRFCGETVTIKCVHTRSYHMNETGSCEFWTDDMIECKVEEETKLEPKFKVGEIVYSTTWQRDVIILDILPDGVYKVGDKHGLGWFKENEDNLLKEKITLPIDSQLKKPFKQEISLHEGYQFVDENYNVINARKVVLEKKKEYPKTYKECCEILGCKANDFFTDFSYNNRDVEISDYEDKIDDLLQNFRKLRYCRDAYWKLYGEKMGLGKPWEPNWTSFEGYPSIYMYRYQITLSVAKNEHHFLVFPSEEMRNQFYENFNELINECKELL